MKVHQISRLALVTCIDRLWWLLRQSCLAAALPFTSLPSAGIYNEENCSLQSVDEIQVLYVGRQAMWLMYPIGIQINHSDYSKRGHCLLIAVRHSELKQKSSSGYFSRFASNWLHGRRTRDATTIDQHPNFDFFLTWRVINHIWCCTHKSLDISGVTFCKRRANQSTATTFLSDVTSAGSLSRLRSAAGHFRRIISWPTT